MEQNPVNYLRPVSKVNPEKLWFNTPDVPTLCRGGGNGPNHPSQLYAIKKYVKNDTFLDYGAGSGTTFEALRDDKEIDWFGKPGFFYLGLDVIPKNTEWCKGKFGNMFFDYNPSIHKIDQPDKSWDVVYSRHVVDHMNSFEEAMDEHCRVAKKLVIVVGWVPFIESEEHEIKNIIDHRGTPEEKLYSNEYTNSYSIKKVLKYLDTNSEWKLLELAEGIGKEVKGHDWIIVLKRK